MFVNSIYISSIIIMIIIIVIIIIVIIIIINSSSSRSSSSSSIICSSWGPDNEKIARATTAAKDPGKFQPRYHKSARAKSISPEHGNGEMRNESWKSAKCERETKSETKREQERRNAKRKWQEMRLWSEAPHDRGSNRASVL